MINIHLVLDEKFIDSSVDMFEKYYPGENFFIVDKDEKERHFVTPRKNVFFIPFQQADWFSTIKKLLNIHIPTVINVVVHYLSKHSANRALDLKRYFGVNKIYWIFYGADLYSYLYETGKYALYDYKVKGQSSILKNYIKRLLGRYNYIEDFCSELDYFCFWNYYDYELLCKYLHTKAKFKLFYYINPPAAKSEDFCGGVKTRTNEINILVNHSASFTGNHLTVLKKISSLSLDNIKLVIPISYGPKTHADLIEKETAKLFPGKCTLLKKYMSREKYYEIIDQCQCAIMGHRRQEAGGNISFLLIHGKKVFLREDNSLLHYYKDLGCAIFSFEKDLKTEKDLLPLTEEEQALNKQIMLDRILPSKVDKMMLNFFN